MFSHASILRKVIFALACLLIPWLLAAQGTPTQVETFTGTTINLNPGSGENVRINVFRWATDAERDAVVAAWKGGAEKGLAAALEKAPTAGHFWDSGPIGYSVRYAQKIALPDRSERIILLTERPLGSSRAQMWKPAKASEAPAYPFTLVELRLAKQGHGEGKMSLGAKVAVDANAGTLGLENYAEAAVLITNVRRVS